MVDQGLGVRVRVRLRGVWLAYRGYYLQLMLVRGYAMMWMRIRG